MTTTAEIEPFRIDIPQGDLDELAARLAATRWPGELAGAGTGYGMPLGTVQRLAERWQNGYDWREHEGRLNQFPQYTTTIDGQNITSCTSVRRKRARYHSSSCTGGPGRFSNSPR